MPVQTTIRVRMIDGIEGFGAHKTTPIGSER
jgi:hypothetical protein